MLDDLEKKWRALTACSNPPECVGGAQFFAWDEYDEGEGVVISIGANYSQHPTEAHMPTKIKLGTWAKNYRDAANLISTKWDTEWRKHYWLVGTPPPLNPKIFIMTNLVPWITSVSWSLLNECSARTMIAEYQKEFHYGHLLDLKMKFPRAFAIGHGANENVLPYLPKAASIWDGWMLWANLTHSKTPNKWDINKQRFVFL